MTKIETYKPRIADKLLARKLRGKSFLMVLTAIGNYAYRREDGILVVPIGSLRD